MEKNGFILGLFVAQQGTIESHLASYIPSRIFKNIHEFTYNH